MNMDRKDSRELEALKSVLDFAYDPETIEDLSEEQVDDQLREFGVDPRQFASSFELTVRSAVARRRRSLASEGRSNLLNRLREKVGAALESMTTREPERAAVYMRKFEGASKADLVRLAQDLNLADELEDLDE